MAEPCPCTPRGREGLQLGLVVPSLLWHQLPLQTPGLGESWQRQGNPVRGEGRFLPPRAAFVPAHNKSLWRGGAGGSSRAGLCTPPCGPLTLPSPPPRTGHLLSEVLGVLPPSEAGTLYEGQGPLKDEPGGDEPVGDGDRKKLESVLGIGRGCLPKHELSFLAEGLAKGWAWTDAPAPAPGDGGPVWVPGAVTHWEQQSRGPWQGVSHTRRWPRGGCLGHTCGQRPE